MCAESVRPFAFADPDVVLLITGGSDGRLELCDCPRVTSPGLARRSTLVASYRAVFPRVVLLDVGDFLWIEPENIRNDWAMRGYRAIGYDLLAPGDQEWKAGSTRLAGLLIEAQADVLATNVAPTDWPADGRKLVKVFRRRWGEAKVAIVSYVGAETLVFVPGQRRRRLGRSDSKALPRRIAALKKEGYLVVLIAHDEPDGAERLARTSGADLVLRGHTKRTDDAPTRVEGVPVLRVGGMETVGVVAMKVRDGRISALDYRSEPLDARWPADNRLLDIFTAYVAEAPSKSD